MPFLRRQLDRRTTSALGQLARATPVSAFDDPYTPAMATFAKLIDGIWISLGRQAAAEFLGEAGDDPFPIAKAVSPVNIFELIVEHLTTQTVIAGADDLHDFLGPHASAVDLSKLTEIADRSRNAARGVGAVPASESGAAPPRSLPPPAAYEPLDPGAWLRIRFDLVNPYAVRLAADHAADLVTVITPETAKVINQTVARSVAGGWDVFETAKRIREVTGLNERWRNAVFNRYQGLLDRGSDPDFASRLANRYAEDLRTKRSMMIARTETMRAANHGRLASYNAAVEAGILSPNVEKEWITAPQGPEVSVSGHGPAKGTKIVSGPCKICAPMNHRKIVGLNQKFELPDGRRVLTPPAHPHCRCTHLVLTPPPPVQRDPTPTPEILRGW